jgi:hypothetical protein
LKSHAHHFLVGLTAISSPLQEHGQVGSTAKQANHEMVRSPWRQGQTQSRFTEAALDFSTTTTSASEALCF